MLHRLFFFGTLRHLPLLEVVLGRSVDAQTVVPACLPHHEACAVAEELFPALVPARGSEAEGVIVEGLSDQDLERLNYYEGGFDYDLTSVTLADGSQARVYVCAPYRWTPTDPWCFEEWVRNWSDMSCRSAREVMGYFGARDREEVGRMLPQIRTRAWARTLAQGYRAGQGTLDGSVILDREARVYAGFFALDEVTLRHARFDGSMSPAVERSYLVGTDAALVLPYDPVRDRVMLVEQVRVGPLGRRDPELWQLEPIAGRVDPGEIPEDTARREAREEARLTLTTLECVARSYASPGSTTDYFHIFVGLAELPDGSAGVAGNENEAEDIRSHLVSYDRFIEMAERQNLANTPLVLLAYWLAHHRKRLRS